MFSKLKYLRSAGFTMIELLVVIAVIGVLAVAVLSSINPIEQINKGRDTRSRSDAAQLISAVDRYFAIHEKYPWNEGTTTDPIIPNAGFDGWSYAAASAPWSAGSKYDTDDYRSSFLFNEQDTLTVTDDSDWAWLLPLVNTAEVKDSFINRIAKVGDNTHFYVKKEDGGNKTMYVCFEPSSYAFDLEATTRCTEGSDTYDSQIYNETEACGAHDAGSSTLCIDNIGDENKCWVCLP